jgi:hypothetical protein
LNGFTKVAEWVSEADVKTKYYIPAEENCIVFLQWFSQDKKRFADVYLSNDCDDKIITKFKRMKIPMRDAK